MPLREIPGLQVTLDKVEYQPQAAAPPERPYCFVYYITIHNHSSSTVTIKGRKWVIKNSQGITTVLEGDGVVGEQPRLEAGQTFSYNSFHLLETPGAVAQGSYFGVDEFGEAFMVRIPSFEMEAPQAWC